MNALKLSCVNGMIFDLIQLRAVPNFVHWERMTCLLQSPSTISTPCADYWMHHRDSAHQRKYNGPILESDFCIKVNLFRNISCHFIKFELWMTLKYAGYRLCFSTIPKNGKSIFSNGLWQLWQMQWMIFNAETILA